MTDKITFTTAFGCYTHKLDIGAYPDGSPMVKLDPGVGARERDVASILLRSTRVDDLLTVLFWVDSLRDRYGETPIVLNLPFVPGGRQDRLNAEGDRLFTLLSVACAINDRNFERVRVLDPHSEVTPALINRCEVLTPSHIAGDILDDLYDAVISPDAGAEKRAMGMARTLGVPLYHAWKSRDVASGAIREFGCEPIPHSVKRALVVDDICDGGGTFLGLRGAVPERVELDLYVTHGLFTAGTEKLRQAFGRIICTDSVCDGGAGITLVRFCEILRRNAT